MWFTCFAWNTLCLISSQVHLWSGLCGYRGKWMSSYLTSCSGLVQRSLSHLGRVSILLSQSGSTHAAPWTTRWSRAWDCHKPWPSSLLTADAQAQGCSGTVSPGLKDHSCWAQTPFQWQLNHRCCPVADTLLCASLSGAAQCWSEGDFTCSKQQHVKRHDEMALESLSGSLKVEKGELLYENVFFSNWFLLALPLVYFHCSRALALRAADPASCVGFFIVSSTAMQEDAMGQVIPSGTLQGMPLASQGSSLALAALNTQRLHWRCGINLPFWWVFL